MAEVTPFKQCPLCARVWTSLSDFVLDTALLVHGYQAHFTEPEQGLIVVTHEVEGCGTTLALRAELVRALYDGPEYTEHLTGTVQCNELCLQAHLLIPCDAPCDMAWVREALQWLLRHELPPHLCAAAAPVGA